MGIADETSAPTETASAEPKAHPLLARLIIAAATLMFIAMMGVIFYRWLMLREATGYLTVLVNEPDNGALIQINDGITSHQATIAADGNYYIARFPLPSARYQVRVSKDANVLWEGEV